jgi:hypothetical protein
MADRIKIVPGELIKYIGKRIIVELLMKKKYRRGLNLLGITQ